MRIRHITLGACLLVACSGESTPTDPGTSPSPNSVAMVEISSTRGALLDIGGTISLRAHAMDSDGQAVSASFTWVVEDTAIAQVDDSGTVTAIARGSTTVSATVGGTTGSFELTVLDADLESIGILLDDPFTDRLLDGLGGSSEASLRAAWADCTTAHSAENLTALYSCVEEARNELSSLDQGPNRPLVSLVELMVDWVERLLDTNP